MPTKEQLFKRWESEFEFPETRHPDDPGYKQPKFMDSITPSKPESLKYDHLSVLAPSNGEVDEGATETLGPSQERPIEHLYGFKDGVIWLLNWQSKNVDWQKLVPDATPSKEAKHTAVRHTRFKKELTFDPITGELIQVLPIKNKAFRLLNDLMDIDSDKFERLMDSVKSNEFATAKDQDALLNVKYVVYPAGAIFYQSAWVTNKDGSPSKYPATIEFDPAKKRDVSLGLGMVYSSDAMDNWEFRISDNRFLKDAKWEEGEADMITPEQEIFLPIFERSLLELEGKKLNVLEWINKIKGR